MKAGTCPHDPLALAIAVGRVPYRGVRGRLAVEDDGSTVLTVDEAGPCELVTGVDAGAFVAWLADRLHQDEHETAAK